MVLAITGGIGSGKSTVSKLFEQRGCLLYISDVEAKRLMVEDPEVRNKIVDLLGSASYLKNGDLHKEHISNLVFRDKSLLQALNNIVHPAVHRDFLEFKTIHQEDVVIYESALILSSSKRDYYDKLIGVVAPIEVRINRVQLRDGVSRKEVEARMQHQVEDSLIRQSADFLIENIELEELPVHVDRILEILKN